MAAEEAGGPAFVRYFAPVLQIVDRLGGSARPAEVYPRVAELVGLDDDQRAVVTSSGQNRFENRVAWARFYLTKAGYLDSSRRGVWSITDLGRHHLSMRHADALEVFREVQRTFTSAQRQSAEAESSEDAVPSDTASPATVNYRDAFLGRVGALSPGEFERFCRRLLLESGFQAVEVTGRSGDGGIDGIGLLQINQLVSVKVLFQCKRYVGSVSTDKIRDFRGAMMGRSDNGIIITTGSFTSDARREAVRDGVPPIELVDGERLVDLCSELQLGLMAVNTFTVDEEFFERFVAG